MADEKERPKHIVEYKEIAELLLRKHNIHEGVWGVFIEFKFAGINTKDPSGNILPAAIVGVQSIGITPFPQESPIAFDAAKLNPLKAGRRKAKTSVSK
jgi:hypothetical protein